MSNIKFVNIFQLDIIGSLAFVSLQANFKEGYVPTASIDVVTPADDLEAFCRGALAAIEKSKPQTLPVDVVEGDMVLHGAVEMQNQAVASGDLAKTD